MDTVPISQASDDINTHHSHSNRQDAGKHKFTYSGIKFKLNNIII